MATLRVLIVTLVIAMHTVFILGARVRDSSRRRSADITIADVHHRQNSSLFQAMRMLLAQDGFANCPLAESKGFTHLLSRDGDQYRIGDGRAGCIGTYSEVMEHCTVAAMAKIREMDGDFERTQFKTSPWRANGTNRKLVVYQASEHMQGHMERIFRNPVNGITPATDFKRVFNAFAAGGCRAAVWGGEVRDAILGIDSMDTDVGWFCDQDSVVEVLKKNRWGGKFRKLGGCPSVEEQREHNLKCKVGTYPNSYVQVGHPSVSDEGFEGKSALENVNGPDSSREFTTNAMAYDPLHAVVIDPTGSGLCDTLSKRVAVAGLHEEGDHALDHQDAHNFEEWKAGSGPENDKMMRLLKLVIPPKRFCVGHQTFALVGMDLFSKMSSGSDEEVQKALSNILSHYQSRGKNLYKYAIQLFWKFCRSIKSLGEELPAFLQDSLQTSSKVCTAVSRISSIPLDHEIQDAILCPASV